MTIYYSVDTKYFYKVCNGTLSGEKFISRKIATELGTCQCRIYNSQRFCLIVSRLRSFLIDIGRRREPNSAKLLPLFSNPSLKSKCYTLLLHEISTTYINIIKTENIACNCW